MDYIGQFMFIKKGASEDDGSFCTSHHQCFATRKRKRGKGWWWREIEPLRETEREKGGSILLNPCHASQFLRWLTMFPSLICPSFLLFIKLTDSMCQSFREELRAEDARNVLGLLLKAQSILENRFSIVFSKRYRMRNSSSTPNSSKTFPEHTESPERTKRVGSLARGDLGFLVG